MSHAKNPKVCSSENMSFTVLLEKANKSGRQKNHFFAIFERNYQMVESDYQERDSLAPLATDRDTV